MKGKVTSAVQPRTVLRLEQKHLAVILLDPRDEILNRFQFWMHRSRLEDPNNGVCMSFMFRVACKRAIVCPTSGLLRNPLIGGTGKKKEQFDVGWNNVEQIGTPMSIR